MLATIVLLSLILVAFWRSTLRALAAGILALVILGIIQIAAVVQVEEPIEDRGNTAVTAESLVE
ncbi:MAG: hypothetical protein ACRDQW_06555 [Haloechinothrix sp.]